MSLGRRERLNRREAHLPTQHPEAGPHPRVPQADVDTGRAGHLEVTAAQGAPPSHRLRRSCLDGPSDGSPAALPSGNCSVPGRAGRVAPCGRHSCPPRRTLRGFFPRWDTQSAVTAARRWYATRSGAGPVRWCVRKPPPWRAAPISCVSSHPRPRHCLRYSDPMWPAPSGEPHRAGVERVSAVNPQPSGPVRMASALLVAYQRCCLGTSVALPLLPQLLELRAWRHSNSTASGAASR